MTGSDLESAATPVAQAAAQDAVGISPARLGAFSDGILAIAATILILDVRTPASGAPVWSSLQAEWPALAAYASTFLIIGIVWIHHHNLFHQVRAVDRTLLFLNLGMLLTIAFLPLPTATLGDHLGGPDGEAAAVFYGLSMTAASGWFVLFWHHLVRHPQLLHPAAGKWQRGPCHVVTWKWAIRQLLRRLRFVCIQPQGSLEARSGRVHDDRSGCEQYREILGLELGERPVAGPLRLSRTA
jgi:uncharacterized membrane protein